jgi:hypothetical protein
MLKQKSFQGHLKIVQLIYRFLQIFLPGRSVNPGCIQFALSQDIRFLLRKRGIARWIVLLCTPSLRNNISLVKFAIVSYNDITIDLASSFQSYADH